MYGSYYLTDEKDNIISMSDEVAIAFSQTDEFTTLHKHGSPDTVRKWYKQNEKPYHELGFTLYYIEGKLPAEELNKMISISGYLPQFIKDKLLGIS